MSLLRQIQDAAIDSSIDLPSLLRKCKVLANRLGSDDFKIWVERELSGYDNVDSIPEYRVFSVNSKGHFSGPFGSELNYADIPLICLPAEYRDNMSKAYMGSPIASIEALVKNNDSGSVREPWDPDFVAHFGRKIYRDMVCMQAWKVIPIGALVATLDSVRTKVLNFVLEIENYNPAAGEAMANEKPVSNDTVQHIFHTYITGDVQNFSSGSTNVSQNASLKKGVDDRVFEKMHQAILEANVPKEIQSDFREVVNQLQLSNGTSAFKEKYQKFMSLLSDHMQVLGPVVAPFLPSITAMLN
ncbi:hypothetical protein [Delftia acidovorans]|uniref:AbiTii domain-containing protein n=1 Tax=Delftia acidovorans TaxID=80866 RepID=UPI001EDFE245|nr:hypothetical protein [Delftia acidovorans]MCG3783318.1 hypothetical protein [Delftia acidovorans]